MVKSELSQADRHIFSLQALPDTRSTPRIGRGSRSTPNPAARPEPGNHRSPGGLGTHPAKAGPEPAEADPG